MIRRIAIIGAGNMGAALALGLAQGSMIAPEAITVSNPSMSKLEALKSDHPGINITTSNTLAIKDADLIVFAVKPWIAPGVIDEIKPYIDYDRQTVASMVGGMPIAEIDKMLSRADGKLPPVVYLIPNTAIAVMQSMTFFTTARCDSDTEEQLLAMFGELGYAMKVEPRFMDAGMAVASCGIAYAMRYARAATEGGVELGLRPADALKAVLQTMKGAAMLLQATGEHPEAAIDQVTTAGGITIRGLNAMEEAAFSGAVIKGLRASRKA